MISRSSSPPSPEQHFRIGGDGHWNASLFLFCPATTTHPANRGRPPRSPDPTGFGPAVSRAAPGRVGPLFGRSWFFGMVERRYSRRHQDNSTRSDRLARSLARSLSGLNNETMEEGSFSLAPSFEGTTHARRRCYKVCRCSFCRHENGELLTQWRPLNRAARARPKVKVDGAIERGLEGVRPDAADVGQFDSWVAVLSSPEGVQYS